MKVVINTGYGGFSLSEAAYIHLGIPWDGYGFAYRCEDTSSRSDPRLVECVEQLGSEVVSGRSSKLKVVEIPNGVDYYIHETRL